MSASGAAHADAQTPAARRELTWRALVTGMLIGAVLTPTNIYSGLKIGWSFNLSITALLLAFAFWRPVQRLLALAPWERYESNIAQTTASSAASIISGGLVAPIPAYLIMSGESIALLPLCAWVFSVSFLGIWVAWWLRAPMLGNPALPFPVGVATAETIRDAFEHGRAAMRRFWAMLSALVFAAGFKLVDAWWWSIPRFAPSAKMQQLTFVFDPSLLMLGFGAIIGLRAGLSLLAGALLAWGVIAPRLIDAGTVSVASTGSGFGPLVEWLIWPGVSLMLMAGLTSIVSGTRAAGPWRGARLREYGGWPLRGFALAALMSVTLQIIVFDITWFAAVLAIPVAFFLAAVAARVVGETGIAPIGSIGKVAQLGFALTAPGHAVTNLMTANVAGGAAGQCADLLNDLKTGQLIGASPWKQAAAQCCGVATGSIVGSIVFLQMIHSPETQLLTEEWPAPAVAVWKAVADALAEGLGSVPVSARWAMIPAAIGGIALALAERLPPAVARRLPSGTTLGLGFVIPASTSITVAAGALLATLLGYVAPRFAAGYLIAIAAGLIAGESLFGVFLSLAGFAGD